MTFLGHLPRYGHVHRPADRGLDLHAVYRPPGSGRPEIPAREPFEAARVDGASRWFIFRNVTLPLLTPYIVIAVIFRLIDSLRQFDIIFGMTKGGPGNTLMNFQVFAYTSTFTYGKPAMGLAYIIVNWLIIFAISFVMVNYWQKVQKQVS